MIIATLYSIIYKTLLLLEGDIDEQATVRIDPRLGLRLAEKKAALDRYRPLSPQVVRRLHEEMRVLLTYHSNAIEGNTLTLRETQLVIEHGVTVGGHSLREYLEATNHRRCLHLLDQARRCAHTHQR